MGLQTDLVDVGHWYGGDLLIGPSGDLAGAVQAERSQQRVLRRLLTSPGDYLSHVDYGAGVPRLVGQTLDERFVIGLIRTQMRRDATVMQSPEPTIRVQPILNGVRADINYLAAPNAIPAVVSFDVDGGA